MTKKLNETHAAYYSSPESHSEKMNAYTGVSHFQPS